MAADIKKDATFRQVFELALKEYERKYPTRDRSQCNYQYAQPSFSLSIPQKIMKQNPIVFLDKRYLSSLCQQNIKHLSEKRHSEGEYDQIPEEAGIEVFERALNMGHTPEVNTMRYDSPSRSKRSVLEKALERGTRNVVTPRSHPK